MNSNYSFRLHVTLPNGEQRCSAFDVDSYCAPKSWAPYDLCSDSFTAALARGVTREQAELIDADREKLAREIAEALTAHILNSIKSRDLRNGYAQEVVS